MVILIISNNNKNNHRNANGQDIIGWVRVCVCVGGGEGGGCVGKMDADVPWAPGVYQCMRYLPAFCIEDTEKRFSASWIHRTWAGPSCTDNY